MIRELELFFVALTFYTRIPCPAWVKHSSDHLRDSARYLSLIGWIVGGFTAVILLVSLLVFPPMIAVVLSTLAGVLLSGGLHEDGLADTCDGFGGGWTKGKILEIMKDSRVGTYGVLGLVFIIMLKVFSLVTLVDISEGGAYSLVLILVSGHGMSRFMAFSAMIDRQYVRLEKSGKSGGMIDDDLRWCSSTVGICLVLALLPLVFFLSVWVLAAVGMMWLTRCLMCRLFLKKIDGYTGDCLGAIQQVSEVVFYLSLVGVWRFI